jgi:bacteriorhodopsin
MELTLSEGQWQLVYNAFSFVFAAMGAAAVFFVLARRYVAPKFRMALILSTLVVTVAGYHYLRIFDSWANGFARLTGGDYQSLGTFNEGYRYVDWLLTVPLLLAELVLLLGLAKKLERSMIIRLGGAAALMIVLGYPGEIAGDAAVKWGWWIAAMIPFAYILYVLYTEFGAAVANQTPRIAGMLKNMRSLLVVSWFFYPIAYLVPLTGLDDASAEVIRQVGYSISDVVAKVVFGLILFAVARAKSEEIGYKAPDRSLETV